MGIDIPMLFMIGDLNSIVFKSENSVEMEKMTREQKIKYNFPLGTIFWPIFPVGGGPSGSVRRGCYNFII